jgi:hypothetical protein
LISEYSTGYVTKSEERFLNQAIIRTAADIETSDKPADRKKSSVIARCLNALGKTMQFGSVITSTYLLGYSDCWFPSREETHDFSAYTRTLLTGTTRLGEDDRELYNFLSSVTEAELGDDEDMMDGGMLNAGKLRPMSEVQKYKQRSPLLSNWSAFELKMCFTQGDKTKDSLFPITGTSLCHRPRKDRQNRMCFVIPRQLKEHPRLPAGEAPSELREEYAAWAMANFFPDTLLHLLEEKEDAPERKLWTMYNRWSKTRPRKERDDFAFHCLENIEQRLAARERMRDEIAKNKGCAGRTVYYDDDDEEEKVRRFMTYG